jgi:hypothetical protein
MDAATAAAAAGEGVEAMVDQEMQTKTGPCYGSTVDEGGDEGEEAVEQ